MSEQGPDISGKPERSLRSKFVRLRKNVHQQVELERRRRIETDPSPTEVEKRLGHFVEELEPQVRDVVVVMNEKGYETLGSGFDQFNPMRQVIYGPFSVDETTRRQLESMGIQVQSEKVPTEQAQIGFYPKEANIEPIKATWNAIAQMLPDKGRPTVCQGSKAFMSFWEQYTETS